MPILPWHQIDTVLLDMDGTLLDLHFDSHFWLHHLPAVVAAQTNQSLAACQAQLQQHYRQVAGTLDWYCLDYWAEQLQLDILAIKQQLAHLIRLRPDTLPFLSALRQADKQLILVTNAHPANLALKLEHTQLDVHIDTLISTHQFGVPKESQALWQQLCAAHPFDLQRTLFVDDNQAILHAARKFGIAHLLAVANPDSQQPPVYIDQFAATTDFSPVGASHRGKYSPQGSFMICCHVGSANPVKVNATQQALALSMGQPVSIISSPAPSGVADQPLSEAETRQGAINRVNHCVSAATANARQKDWFVAIEGGAAAFTDGPATFAYVAIYHQAQWSIGRSANLPLPLSVFNALQEGEELGIVMDRVFGTTNIKQQGGAIGLLTNHLATRQSVYELAMILALAKFNHPAIYAGM